MLGKMPQKVCGTGLCFSGGFPSGPSSPCLHPVFCGYSYSPVVVSVGVLPPEGFPCAAAPGFAPRAECAPGSGAGSETAFCGQQALPHQQGSPAPLRHPLSPLLPVLPSGPPQPALEPGRKKQGHPHPHPVAWSSCCPPSVWSCFLCVGGKPGFPLFCVLQGKVENLSSLFFALLPTVFGTTGGPLCGWPGGPTAVCWAFAHSSG